MVTTGYVAGYGKNFWPEEQSTAVVLDPQLTTFDGTIPYRLSRAYLVPARSGVYLFHDLRGVLYIGRSDNLRRRFDQHSWRAENPRLAAVLASPIGALSFSWRFAVGSEQELLERVLIRFFAPSCNRILYRRDTLPRAP